MSVFHYTDHNGRSAQCGLNIFHRHDKVVVVLSELASNDGGSITNSIELLATQLFTAHPDLDVDADKVVWIEHYGPFSYPPMKGEPRKDEYTLVELAWDGERFYSPVWRFIGPNLSDIDGVLATTIARQAAKWDECSDSEWLGTYYSETLSEQERALFGDFGTFEARVRSAIKR